MSQIVVEFGAPEYHPTLSALLAMIERPTAIVTECKTGGSEQFSATPEAIEAISQKFEHGEIVSATFRTESEGVRYGLITAPHYNGQRLSMWLGTVELTAIDWRSYWNALLRLDGLMFVCVGDEEGVELTDDNLTLASFPYNQWPMVVGALRNEQSGPSWVIRERSTI